MRKRVANGIYWPQDFGWRIGDEYHPPVRLASQVVRYEQEVLGNEMGVPEFMLAEIDRIESRPRDLLWVCLTKDAVRHFARKGDGEPYKVWVGEDALVLCADGEGGYLLLFEYKRLRSSIIELFDQLRREKQLGSFPERCNTQDVRLQPFVGDFLHQGIGGAEQLGSAYAIS